MSVFITKSVLMCQRYLLPCPTFRFLCPTPIGLGCFCGCGSRDPVAWLDLATALEMQFARPEGRPQQIDYFILKKYLSFLLCSIYLRQSGDVVSPVRTCVIAMKLDLGAVHDTKGESLLETFEKALGLIIPRPFNLNRL